VYTYLDQGRITKDIIFSVVKTSLFFGYEWRERERERERQKIFCITTAKFI